MTFSFKMDISYCVLVTLLVFQILIQYSYQTSSFYHHEPAVLNQNNDPAILPSGPPPFPNFYSQNPIRIKSKRKRGKKGGVKSRMRRRRYNPVVPTIMTGNARSLNNKIDELETCVKSLYEYRDASFICFSESWFKEDCPDSSVQLDNFHLCRNDRDCDNTAKSRGGGVCIYTNNKYCHTQNVHVLNRASNPDIEILSVSIRPHYLPREFTKIIVNIVYIPDQSSAGAATTQLSTTLNDQLTSSPDAFIVVTGDFNHAALDPGLRFYQHVTKPTRQGATLDLCYTNIKKCYKCKTLPPLGKSDHEMVLLMPNYKTKLIDSPPVEKEVFVYNKEACTKMTDCFELTDWNVFTDSCADNLDELNDHVSCYIQFCEESNVQKKTVKIYANQKPWVDKHLKSLIKEKRNAYLQNDKEKLKIIQKQIDVKISENKKKYKERIENKFKNNDSRGTWDGIKTMVGYNKSKSTILLPSGEENEYVDDLNSFYARFDCFDFSEKHKDIRQLFSKNKDNTTPVTVNTSQVEKSLNL